jgi:predicted GNAT superfamily acetyltransferase
VPPLNYVSQPSNLMLVEIPADFQAIKRLDFGLARRWREHTRHLFEELFHSGFMITDFINYAEPDGRNRSYYLLAYHSA